MIEKFGQISSELIFKNPYWDYKKDVYKLPNNENGEYHYIETSGSVFVIPIFNSKLILVNQFRYLNQQFSLEFPGGGINPNFNTAMNAQKELSEESGFKSNKLSLIGKFNPFNGVTNEFCFVFLAEELIKYQANADASEEFEILNLTVQEFEQKIADGTIWDGMTLAAWSLFKYSKYFKEIM